jgi:hypothetical protein
MTEIKYLPQPIPKVTRSDVERVAKRDFPPDGTAALDVLRGCHGLSLAAGEHRVHLAILKLGNSNLERVRFYVDDANCDPRNVLAGAEYPEYARAFAGSRPLEQQKRIIDSDWKQYQDWLNR